VKAGTARKKTEEEVSECEALNRQCSPPRGGKRGEKRQEKQCDAPLSMGHDPTGLVLDDLLVRVYAHKEVDGGEGELGLAEL
jgi:hypothetical protein